MTLCLGGRRFAASELLVMAVVNRTRDSFYDRGANYEEAAALDTVRRVVAEGAAIVDIGGVRAGYGEQVDVTEEIRRTAGFVATVRAEFPDLLISVDTWRHQVAEQVCQAGADLINDAWGGADPRTAEVAARHRVGLVCTHVGGQRPRTDPHRVHYDDVMAAVVDTTTALARRAVDLGVPAESILLDPAHDFGKNTYHSLEATRRTSELVATGFPVLVAVSNKDFVGETLDVPTQERVVGTLATLSVTALLGAQVFRVHNVAEARAALDQVGTLMAGDVVAGGTSRSLL
jgi:dihydropteroate synthase